MGKILPIIFIFLILFNTLMAQLSFSKDWRAGGKRSSPSSSIESCDLNRLASLLETLIKEAEKLTQCTRRLNAIDGLTDIFQR
uniref:Uncharacterized protein n=1 Tax=Tetranychus urticae TaxID=32264 RepID=T1KR46_TETUR